MRPDGRPPNGPHVADQGVPLPDGRARSVDPRCTGPADGLAPGGAARFAVDRIQVRLHGGHREVRPGSELHRGPTAREEAGPEPARDRSGPERNGRGRPASAGAAATTCPPSPTSGAKPAAPSPRPSGTGPSTPPWWSEGPRRSGTPAPSGATWDRSTGSPTGCSPWGTRSATSFLATATACRRQPARPGSSTSCKGTGTGATRVGDRPRHRSRLALRQPRHAPAPVAHVGGVALARAVGTGHRRRDRAPGLAAGPGEVGAARVGPTRPTAVGLLGHRDRRAGGVGVHPPPPGLDVLRADPYLSQGSRRRRCHPVRPTRRRKGGPDGAAVPQVAEVARQRPGQEHRSLPDQGVPLRGPGRIRTFEGRTGRSTVHAVPGRSRSLPSLTRNLPRAIACEPTRDHRR